MHRIVVVVVVVGAMACSKGRKDDCAIVRDKPTDALAELSKRYPNNPVKVAEVIEACIAPAGKHDECERIAKVVAAIPALTPQIPVKPADYAKTCREAPPEFRRCLLPSYALAHAGECRDVTQQAITKIDIKPSTERAATDCGFVAIYVDQQGTWLATGRDDKARCYAPRKSGAIDVDWLEAQLRKAKAHECGPSSAEIAAGNDVAYRDVITAMDVAVKVGFVDTGLSAPDKLAVPLASANPKGAASECPPTLIAPDPKDTPASAPTPPASGTDALKTAPVLVIAKDKLTLDAGGKRTDVMTLEQARSGSATLDPLAKALPPTKDGLLILQADASTPSSVINRVVQTAKTAGYDNVLFAVKNK